MRHWLVLLLFLALAAPSIARERGDGNGKGDPQDDKRCPVVTCEPCACPDPGPTAAPCECDETGCHRCEQGGCIPCAPECLPTSPSCPTITVAPVDCGVKFPIYAPCRARKNGKVRAGDIIVDGVAYKCPRKFAPQRFFVPVR